MTIFEYAYPYPVERVWAVFVNADSRYTWTFPVRGYRAEPGHTFAMDHLPFLGTRFDGTIYCEIVATLPYRLWSARWHAGARWGRSAQWLQHIEFVDDGMRTKVHWSLIGVRLGDAHERVLHHVYSRYAERALADLHSYLDSLHSPGDPDASHVRHPRNAATAIPVHKVVSTTNAAGLTIHD